MTPAAEGIDESGVPAQGFVPTATGEHAPVPAAGQGYTIGSEPAGTAPTVGGRTVFDSEAK